MPQSVQRGIKRLADIGISLVILVLFSPVWILTALLIKLTSPGPALFLQDRPGRKGKCFKVYKFRSMRLGSERMVKGVEVLPDDDRVTAVGRFIRRTKIDEIPQCINVLRGEMSLVGPRPERVGSWLDVYYVEHFSLWLDIRILARTVGVVLLGEERYMRRPLVDPAELSGIIHQAEKEMSVR